jgi:hypothetical protein
MIAAMAGRLRSELLTSRNLWERRLIGSVTQIWGLSPFSSVLRVYNGLGNLIASSTLFRARTSAQMALIGAVQGARWLHSKRQEQDAETRLERVTALGLDDAELREAQVIISGYAQAAQLDPRLAASGDLDALRHEAVRVEDQFLGDAGRRVDEIIDQLSLRHSGFFSRIGYELLLGVFLAYVLVRAGKNFFWDSVFSNIPIMTLDFYIPAAIFLLLWSGLLVMLFTQRLRGGLHQQIDQLAQAMAQGKISAGLFPRLEQICRNVRMHRERLEALSQNTAHVRRQIATASGLGGQIPAPRLRSPTVVSGLIFGGPGAE